MRAALSGTTEALIPNQQIVCFSVQTVAGCFPVLLSGQQTRALGFCPHWDFLPVINLCKEKNKRKMTTLYYRLPATVFRVEGNSVHLTMLFLGHVHINEKTSLTHSNRWSDLQMTAHAVQAGPSTASAVWSGRHTGQDLTTYSRMSGGLSRISLVQSCGSHKSGPERRGPGETAALRLFDRLQHK